MMLSAAQRRAQAEQGAKWRALPLHRGTDSASIAAHIRYLARLSGAGRKASAAVNRMLETPDAERCWLGGEDILQGLAQDLPMPPPIESEIRRLVDFVAPTVSVS